MLEKLRSPEIILPSKPKFMISGDSGSGKTYFSLDFPKPIIVDAEQGSTRPQYQEKLKKSGGMYFGREDGASSFVEVIKLVKELSVKKHDFKTLIIDSFSYLYLAEAAEAEARVGNDFGRDSKEANKPTRQLISALEKLDLTIILIAHSKDKWERKGKEVINVGNTFDGYPKLEFILDLWIEIMKGSRTFTVKKSRIASLPQGESFPLSYDKFKDLYGEEALESAHVPVVLATKDQITRLFQLIDALKVPDETLAKWLAKCNCDAWDEMTDIQINSCIGFCEKKILELNVKQ